MNTGKNVQIEHRENDVTVLVVDQEDDPPIEFLLNLIQPGYYELATSKFELVVNGVNSIQGIIVDENEQIVRYLCDVYHPDEVKQLYKF